jgi:hypothetical protein
MIGKRIIFAALLMPWLLLTAPMVGTGASAADDAFLAGTADLPLMPGLREIPEATMVFDKPDGRLIQAVAVSKINGTANSPAISPAALWRFYDETLPQLGWRRAGQGFFVRDGEGLRISVEKNGPALTVRFAIAPGTE